MCLDFRELKRSILWTVLIGTLVIVFGVVFARSAAHSSGLLTIIYHIFLAPSMSVGLVESKIIGKQLSPSIALALGLVFHYIAYFLIILGVRFGYKQFLGKKG